MSVARPYVAQIPPRLARMYALRDRLDVEIRAAEQLAAVPCHTGPRRSRYKVPDCGTESAYQRHRYRGEKLDTAEDPCGCVAAHNEHNRIKDADRKRRVRVAIATARLNERPRYWANQHGAAS